MEKAGSESNRPANPQWLLAEVTYRCPLQCLYCSNPLDFAAYQQELSTDTWLRVLQEARALGAVQLGFSGGEPLVRKDLEVLVAESRKLGYYSNLITSGIGMDEARLAALKEAGLDHVQISFQASSQELNDYIGGAKTFEKKMEMARLIKQYDYPMVLNVVLHRHNIDAIASILDMAETLEADYVELANTQYYGWALLNRSYLLPSREQVEQAKRISQEYQTRLQGQMRILYVIPDYYADRPKPCMAGWGSLFMAIAPDGTALPCHAARQIPSLTFPNVQDMDLRSIWYDSPIFNAYRGDDWMREPCRSCPEKEKDFGGCRCQAFQLTGDAANTDPVCDLSPQHDIVLQAIEEAGRQTEAASEPLFRTVRHSRELAV